MDRVAPDLIRHRRALYRARAPLPGHAPSAMADDSPPHMVPATHPEPHHDGPLDRACVHARSGRLRRPGRGLRFRNRSQPKPETRPCSENPLNAKPRPHRRIGADPDRRSHETHYPREGVGNWVWAAVQPLLAVFAIYPSRARYVILDFIGEQCAAVVTTDRYAGYAFIDAERRQVCWAECGLQAP